MNEDIKSIWIDALLSDEYTQGQRRLRTEDNKYCCLGVLCDLAVKAGIAKWAQLQSGWVILPINDTIEDVSSFDLGIGILPRFIMKWADIKDPSGWIETLPIGTSLADLNDRGYDFEFIARKICESL